MKMRTWTRMLAMAMVVCFLMIGSAMAYELGKNITIYDKMGVPAEKEDGTVEPSCVWGQVWDLEGFFLNGTVLNMVGGYDFINGGYGSGDLFIDTTGDVKYGNPAAVNVSNNANTTIKNTLGYDYVFDMDFSKKTFTLYSINADSYLEDVYYNQNSGSNPWRYKSGGTLITSGNFGYTTGLKDSDVANLKGDRHNVVSVDLSFFADKSFTAHFTMGCGNDNLMGQGEVPTPEPGTILLLGAGLAGLVAFRKKFRK